MDLQKLLYTEKLDVIIIGISRYLTEIVSAAQCQGVEYESAWTGNSMYNDCAFQIILFNIPLTEVYVFLMSNINRLK